jgi:Fe2+ or Zn2+ uptake regulation protein
MNPTGPAAPWRIWERAILDHLDAHPHAADSADGVARWWLGVGAAAAPADVRRALDELVARGRLRCVPLADGTHLYSSAAGDPQH